MIIVQNHVGKITITQDYLMALIGNTVTSCFGVVSMNISSPRQMLTAAIPFTKKKDFERGVAVRVGKDKLLIDLHISLMYGVNMNAVVRSIINKVTYAIEESTGISVERVNVFVDDIRI